MGINDFVTAMEAVVSSRPLPAPPRPVRLADADDAEEVAVRALGVAEGQSFMIEYVDSAGRPSTRRITVFGIVVGRGGIPLLNARCHERNALRQFRVDRIRCCIDYSGEVHDDVAAFLVDSFGMDADIAHRRAGEDADARWRDIIDLVRDDAVVLAAMSQSDGLMHRSEVLTIVRHLVALVERHGVLTDESDAERITTHVGRLRPTGAAIARALDGLGRQDASHVQRVLRAALAVLDADGRRHPAEIALLDGISRELTGVGVVSA